VAFGPLVIHQAYCLNRFNVVDIILHAEGEFITP
jgi:hypothetical protein